MMDRQLFVILGYGVITFGLGAWNGFDSGERNGRIDVASGEIICERVDDGRETRWVCDE